VLRSTLRSQAIAPPLLSSGIVISVPFLQVEVTFNRFLFGLSSKKSSLEISYPNSLGERNPFSSPSYP
jgi:hypothetical protein